MNVHNSLLLRINILGNSHLTLIKKCFNYYNLVVFCALSSLCYVFRSSREYHQPLESDALQRLTKKTFSSETMKKVSWVKGMFQEWRYHRNMSPNFSDIVCDLDNISSITKENVIFAVCRFITEVKKLDGSDFPPKT